MSAYFSLSIELPASPNAVRHFFSALQKNGAIFKCGFLDAQNDSYDELIQWNQRYMEGKETGYDKKTKRSCIKQLLFDFDEFSEFRAYLSPISDESFCVDIIVPEEDLYEYNDLGGSSPIHKKHELMDVIKNLALDIWRDTPSTAIQTAWECSDVPPYLQEIQKNTPPMAEPFCIIPASLYKEAWKMPAVPTEKDGVLIEIPQNWFYV